MNKILIVDASAHQVRTGNVSTSRTLYARQLRKHQ